MEAPKIIKSDQKAKKKLEKLFSSVKDSLHTERKAGKFDEDVYEKLISFSERLQDIGLSDEKDIKKMCKALKRLQEASPSEKTVTSDIVGYLEKSAKDNEGAEEARYHVSRFLKGGYIIFPDDGAKLHEKWSTLQTQTASVSKGSRKVGKEEYVVKGVVKGKFVEKAIFGTVKEGKKSYTWLKLEKDKKLSFGLPGFRSTLRYLLNALLKGMPSILMTKQQKEKREESKQSDHFTVGPYGKSIVPEHDSLYIRKYPERELLDLQDEDRDRKPRQT